MVPQRGAPAKKPSPVEAQEKPDHRLDKLSLDYLELVATEPFLSIRERGERLCLSSWKADRIKKDLLGDGLVREVPVNPGGRGERFKLLELTADGRKVLADFGVPPAVGLGRGGVAHQWWVSTIGEWLRDQGLPFDIEDESRGVRVDLAVAVGRKRVAIEVETSAGHAAENVAKDLAARFDQVVSLLDDPAHLDRLEEELEADSGEIPPLAVHVGNLADYQEILGAIVSHPPSPLRPPSQNEEPRRQPGRRRRRPAPRQSPPAITGELGALSTPAAAEYTGLSPATLETMRSRGGGPPFVKLGSRVVYRREDLDTWLAERRRSSTSDPGSGRS